MGVWEGEGWVAEVGGWVRRLTVANYIAVLVFCNCEERGPVDEVVHVEVDVVVFGEGIEVGEVHVEEVLGAEGAEGCHDV